MDKRARLIVKGRVQKAGFREFVDEIAFELGLRGYVKNLADGTVEIVCEGELGRIRRLKKMINIRKYPIRVDRIGSHLSAPTGEFMDFNVVRDDQLDGDLNGKLGLGVMLMRDLAGKQDRSLEKQDATLHAVKAVDGDIKTMDSHIGGHFDRLDAKYDNFGASLAQAAGDIHDMKGDIGHVRSDIHSLASPRRRKKA